MDGGMDFGSCDFGGLDGGDFSGSDFDGGSSEGDTSSYSSHGGFGALWFARRNPALPYLYSLAATHKHICPHCAWSLAASGYKYCPECGRALKCRICGTEAVGKFCTECGARIIEEE